MKQTLAKNKTLENKGHRFRLKNRFDLQGEQALADYELLELILFQSISRKDTKPIAKALLKKFHNLANIINASHKQLTEVEGVGKNTARDIKTIYAMIKRTIKINNEKRHTFDNWKNLINYCNNTMANLKTKQFHILFLDMHQRLIVKETQNANKKIYPKKIIKQALKLQAGGIVLVHNYPFGEPKPSPNDIKITQKIIENAKYMKIEVHDHIIIGKNGHTSLKGQQII